MTEPGTGPSGSGAAGQREPRPPVLPVSVLGLLTIIAYGAIDRYFQKPIASI